MHELGRALFHLNQKRGFKSNRKYDNQEAENSNMKIAMKEFKENLSKSNSESVGEYFYHKLENNEKVRITVSDSGGKNIYSYVLNREQIEDEFEKLWEMQKKFHPQLTSEAKEEVYHAIFWQRELKAQQKGKCQFETGEPRISKAHPLFQKYRIVQEVNNLTISNFSGEKRELTLNEKLKLINKLCSQLKCKFSSLRSELFGRTQAKDYEFNFETSATRDGFQGDETSHILRGKKCFSKKWDEFSDSTQNLIVERLLNEENDKNIEKELVPWLIKEFDLTKENAQYISTVSLPSGYSNISKKAIEKLLPHMQKGLQLHEAIEGVGYSTNRYDGTLYDEGNLPYYGQIMPHHAMFGNGDAQQIPEVCYGKIGNPTVHIVLNQLRTIVNSICKKYGAPSEIVIELARDLKIDKKTKDKINKSNRLNEKLNQEAENCLKSNGIISNYLNKTKYKLWKELSKNEYDRCCPYTGKQISFSKLFSNEIEIEHILPKSRTFDDSYANKTLSYRQANLDKGNRSPYEAFGENKMKSYDWEKIFLRAKDNLPSNKSWRFYPDAMEKYEGENPIIARMLNDTKYASKIAKEYMQYVCGANNVWTIQGQLTAKLRHHWGLNKLISQDNEKNREDHRHHAIDAFVVACTTRSMLQKISKQMELARGRLIEKMPPPFSNFSHKQMQEKVNNIVVSHRQDHHGARKHIKTHPHIWNKKTFGQLHEETAYGLFGATIKLNKLKKEDMPYLIHNPHYQELKKYLEGEIEKKDVPKDEILLRFNKRFDLYQSSLINRIDKILLSIRETTEEGFKKKVVKSKNPATIIPIYDKKGVPYKYFVSGNNYCLEVYVPNRGKNAGKYQMEVISNYQAHQPNFTPKWRKEEPEAKLIMRLFINDIVIYYDENDQPIIGRVKKMDQSQFYIKDINASNSDNGVSFSVSKLEKTKAHRVYISPIGELYGQKSS